MHPTLDNAPMPASPQLGLLLPSREALLWADGDPEVVLAAARHAEATGFDSAWIGDSLLARPRFEPLTLLAALLTATRRIRLGTAVLLPLLRHPLTLAHSLATLDRLAPGRLIVGVGAGGEVPATYAELAAVGVSGTKRVSCLLDRAEMWRRLWRGDDPQTQLLPAPATPNGPPLWLAGQGPRILRAAGRQFQGWVPYSPTAAAYGAGLAAVRAEAERAGRDPGELSAAAYLTVAVDDRPGDASARLDRYMLAYYGRPASAMAQVQGIKAGPIESVTEWVAGYTAAGADHLILRVGTPDLPAHHDVAAALLAALRA
jgi:alkanesulfonate monooxygenase SsuD/methylene tetrahydromethanopterin reductase-like flavin-dependent oxidoreductase (luciferase family)